jgi:hypothetical protein
MNYFFPVLEGNKDAKLEIIKYLQAHPTGDAVIIPRRTYNSGIMVVS